MGYWGIRVPDDVGRTTLHYSDRRHPHPHLLLLLPEVQDKWSAHKSDNDGSGGGEIRGKQRRLNKEREACRIDIRVKVNK